MDQFLQLIHLLHNMKNKGFTLIEIVLYIGLIMILLPSIVLMLLEVQKNQAHTYNRMLIEQTSAIILSEFQNQIVDAYSINVSGSLFDTDESSILFRKAEAGQVYELSYQTDTVNIGSVLYNIGRVSFDDGTSHWITPEQIAVTMFRVEPVRNGLGQLTALNFELELSPLQTTADMDKSNILYTHTTISLFPNIIEE